MPVMFPKWFFAKQVYVYNPPCLQTVTGNSSVLAIINISLESFPLYHVILGSGFPSTGQEIFAGQFFWYTNSVWFPSITNGGTERGKSNCWLVQFVQCYIHYNFDITNMLNREHYVSLLLCSSDTMDLCKFLYLFPIFRMSLLLLWLQDCLKFF